MDNIALVTPLKDEIKNIDRLIKSISNQSIKIHTWIILENDSTDGSKEKLSKINSIPNVENFEVLNLELPNKEYALGTKYASIIETGFNQLKQENYFESLDFIGILDSDIFVEKDYYKKLIQSFINNPKLGITSGRIIDEKGNYDLASKKWVRGGCRLWKKECFVDAGYIVGPSADTLSTAKARIKKWEVYPTDAIAISRQVGSRVNYSYYAKSAYFRGHTLLYMILKAIVLLFKGHPQKSVEYVKSYLIEYKNKSERINDVELRNYFKNYLVNKVFNK